MKLVEAGGEGAKGQDSDTFKAEIVQHLLTLQVSHPQLREAIQEAGPFFTLSASFYPFAHPTFEQCLMAIIATFCMAPSCSAFQPHSHVLCGTLKCCKVAVFSVMT